jgi:hypothetical protein
MRAKSLELGEAVWVHYVKGGRMDEFVCLCAVF